MFIIKSIHKIADITIAWIDTTIPIIQLVSSNELCASQVQAGYLISYAGLRMDKASLVRQGAVGANKNIVRDALAKDFDLVIEGSTNKPQTAVYIQPTQAL